METIEVERRIAATPDIVFGYLTDSKRYVRWMGVDATLDPRPGGVYRVSTPDGGTAVGEFVEVVSGRRVVFTWGWEGNSQVPPGSTRVEVTLESDGAGTMVRLVHSGLPDPAMADLHRSGWDRYLDRLVVLGAGDDPGPDRI